MKIKAITPEDIDKLNTKEIFNNFRRLQDKECVSISSEDQHETNELI